uniref:FAD/NAD(P)-binding domain-containing protein n=1 Tax=Arundo donax TaxID=35708 RepID=A0A0A9CE05_ARUDO
MEVFLHAGKAVSSASVTENGKFVLKVEKRTVDFVDYINANYLLIATGSSQQDYSIAAQLGHSIVAPVPSLFTFKIADKRLADLSGVFMHNCYCHFRSKKCSLRSQKSEMLAFVL